MYILSVDFGTSSVKSAILNERLETVATSKVEYQLNVFDNDKVELNPDDVFGALIKSIVKMKDFVKDVGIIGYDTFSPSPVFMDEQGNALYPIITHLDRRAREQTKEIVRVMGEDRFQQITGILPFTGGASVTSMMWMKKHKPEIFNSTYKIGHMNTYIYKKLTGVWATEQVNASMMALYETVTEKGWSKEITETFGIPVAKLPDIFPAGSVLGKLTNEIAALTGLKEGIPVVLGSNDAATAHIGAGNTKAGDILDISGSSEMVTILTDKPVVNKKYYLRKAVNPGMWQIFAITTAGFAIDWFREEFYKDMDKDVFFNEYMVDVIENRLKKSTVKFLPYLTGDRQSLKKKRGTFNGLTLGSTREDMLIAILYGYHDPILDTIKIVEKSIELNKTIKLTGGLVENSYINLKRQVLKGYDFEVVENCPIMGNARLALQALEKGI